MHLCQYDIATVFECLNFSIFVSIGRLFEGSFIGKFFFFLLFPIIDGYCKCLLSYSFENTLKLIKPCRGKIDFNVFNLVNVFIRPIKSYLGKIKFYSTIRSIANREEIYLINCSVVRIFT